VLHRDVTEPAEISFRCIRIVCFKSVAFGFAVRSQLQISNSIVAVAVISTWCFVTVEITATIEENVGVFAVMQTAVT